MVAPLAHYPPNLTVPAPPSTVIVWPSLIKLLPTFVPTTAGIWYSLATMAVCDKTPP